MSAAPKIAIPETSQQRPERGTIVAWGRACHGEFQVGDRIVFAKQTGTTIRIDGVEYLLLRESDLMAVIL